jgi:hypothetical protein
VLNLGMGLFPLLNNFAHVGGFIAGFFLALIMLVLKERDARGLEKDPSVCQWLMQVGRCAVVGRCAAVGQSSVSRRSVRTGRCAGYMPYMPYRKQCFFGEQGPGSCRPGHRGQWATPLF